MEHLGFLVKEKSCGNESFADCSIQKSDQRRTEFPLFGEHIEMLCKIGKSFIMSFHQGEPTGLLA